MPDDLHSTFDPRALHQEIEALTRRLHGLVEETAACTDRLPDDAIVLSLAQYERLIELAGSSPDLLGRSRVTFDQEEAGWTSRRDDFQSQVLADLSTREDLDYETFCDILDNLELDEAPSVPPSVAPAMVRAWNRLGTYSDTERWRDADSWSRVPCEDAQVALESAVELCVLSRLAIGSREDDLTFWIKTVAPEACPDARERLEWLAAALTGPSRDGDLGELGEFLGEIAWKWFGKVEGVAERLLGLRAIREIARSGLDRSGELEEGVNEAWTYLISKEECDDDTRAVIAAEVKAAITGAQTDSELADEVERWVVAVAPSLYPDVADRLLWFVETVGRVVGDAPMLPSDVVDTLTEHVCEWLEEVAIGADEDVGAVLRAFRRTPTGGCLVKADVEASLELLK